MKLNLGSGAHLLPAPWLNVDFYRGEGVQPDVELDLLSQSALWNYFGRFPVAEEILASHVLEHFSWDQDPLGLWVESLLLPGGRFIAVVPDLSAACTLAQEGRISREWLRDLAFGMECNRPGQQHHRIYTSRILIEEMQAVGLERVQRVRLDDPRLPPLASGITEQAVVVGFKRGA